MIIWFPDLAQTVFETKYSVSETGSSHMGLTESVILSHWKDAYAEVFNWHRLSSERGQDIMSGLHKQLFSVTR